MKNLKVLVLCLIFVIISSVFLSYTSKSIEINAKKDVYAKITTENAILYSENQEAIIVLPESYYVLVLGESDMYYYTKYKNIYGYVLKSDVKLSSTPKKPFQEDFVFYPVQNINFCKTTSLSTSFLTLTTNNKLYYLGYLTGESVNNLQGNLWYYVYTIIDGEIVYGYVYSLYTTGISGNVKNTENTTLLTTKYEDIKNMKKSTFVIIIILTIIPMIFILYLLFTNKIKIYRKEDFL